MSRLMTSELSEAIEGLYATFARYSALNMGGHCDTADDSEGNRLGATPLRELTHQDLSLYAFKAMSTWGSVDEYKHFLPRLMELVAQAGRVGDTEVWVVLAKPGYGELRKWPAAERESVERFFLAVWRKLLSAYPTTDEIEYWYDGIAHSVDDLGPYFAELVAARDEPAVRQLADFVAYYVGPLTGNHVNWARLDEAIGHPESPRARALRWVLSDERVEQLRRLFFEARDGEFAARVSAVEEMLSGVLGRWRVVKGG
ncbi:MAG: hypothetical protein ACAI43_24050 [Phycisphaerae bacterium]|nr:hypothetical protein [Tepidisphaeraceae bacterium]